MSAFFSAHERLALPSGGRGRGFESRRAYSRMPRGRVPGASVYSGQKGIEPTVRAGGGGAAVDERGRRGRVPEVVRSGASQAILEVGRPAPAAPSRRAYLSQVEAPDARSRHR